MFNSTSCTASCSFKPVRLTVREREVTNDSKMAEEAPAPAPAPAAAAPAKAPEIKAAKAFNQRPSIGELVVKLVTASKERNGMSFVAVKKALKAGGYDVEKNNSRLKVSIRGLLEKGTLVQTKGTGASGSFKINKYQEVMKKEPAKKAVKVKKPAAKKPATDKKQKKVAAKKPAAKKAKKPATPKKVTKSPKKASSAKKKAAAPKKPAKSPKKSKKVAKPKTVKPKKAAAKK
ncbi:hypothetical protein JZ751_018383 [Albula glossodonta]|uniref:H15 domain-containing protein n=1 Tax=Albula glossodonta TaxID=121402 RepID=A0A8T2MIT8_9TELE|nr:hypothetical protein JZ751_018383 [Albula glossodonta]